MLEENEWDKWKREHEAKFREESKQLASIERALSRTKRPINDHEREMILALAKCTFLPGSWDKKFVHSLAIWQPYGNSPHYETVEQISEEMSYWLCRLAHKYRKQIGQDLSQDGRSSPA